MGVLMGNKSIAAQCWYSAEQYAQIKARMEDGDRLPAAHVDWQAGAEQREEIARRNGAQAVRVPFDLAEFERFCAAFGLRLNSEARAKFAAIKAHQMRGH